MQSEIWIALVGVNPQQGSSILGGARGAWVNVLANAASPEAYMASLRTALNHYRLDLVAVEELEQLNKRVERTKVDVELLLLASELTEPGSLRFGSFYTFDQDGLGRQT